MKIRTAYTVVLVQVPPLAIGVVGMIAGFLQAGIPALRLHVIGASADTVQQGVLWGSAWTALSVLGCGLVLLFGMRFVRARLGTRRAGALAMLLAGPAGFGGVLLGAWAGPVLAGADRTAVTAHLAACWTGAVPVLVGAAAMAAALALHARKDARAQAS